MPKHHSMNSLRKLQRKRKTHSKGKFADHQDDVPLATEVALTFLDAPVVCVNRFEEDTARDFADALSFFEQDKSIDKILVKIDSYGGDMYAVLSMIESIEACSKPVYTFCSGKAMSAGALLLSAGKKRFVGKYSTVMVHEVQGEASGSTAQVHADATEQIRLQDLYVTILAKNCKKKVDQVKTLLGSSSGADVFLNAKQAKEFGLVDKIGTPKVNKKTTWHFSLDEEEG